MFSPDSKHVVYEAMIGNKWFIVLDGKEEKQYDWIANLVLSSDGRHVAYAAKAGNTWFTVLDGEEGKQYNGFERDSHVFSPDNKHLAYAAEANKKWLLVMDGKEIGQFDAIVANAGGKIIFDSSDRLHFLAIRGNSIYLIEQNIQ